MAIHDFGGNWHSIYWYTSSAKPGMFTSEYDVTIKNSGNQLIIESKPNEEESYILVRLSLDGRVATGTYEERTSPKGWYKGVVYTGAIQLVFSEDGQMLDGMYIAHDRRMEVRTNHWQISRMN